MNQTTKQTKILLIVEDDLDLREILQETLTPVCDRVLLAENGLEALTLVKNFPEISAIISDINMPKMSGLELLKTLRSDFNPVPFIVLTGFGDSNSYQQAVKLNATDFLAKPYSVNELLEVVRKALEYGVELTESENRLEDLYRESGLSAEKIEEIKRLKRTVMAMRIEKKIYTREPK